MTTSRMKNITFTVTKEIEGASKTFLILFSRTAHNILLKKALLRKLGYKVPPTKYIPTLRIRFGNRMEKDIFVARIKDEYFADPARWVVEGIENEEPEIVMQDVVAFED